MSIDPLQLGLGAVLGFLGTGSLRWWQYRRDLWLGEVERFCDTLDGAAECATEYWLRGRLDADPPDAGDSDTETDNALSARREVDLYEAKLMGFQTRLDGLSASISDRLLHQDVAKLNKSMAGISEALTGGEYRSATRDPDPDRAQLAQVYASDMLVDTRRALARALSLTGTVIHYWERIQKNILIIDFKCEVLLPFLLLVRHPYSRIRTHWPYDPKPDGQTSPVCPFAGSRLQRQPQAPAYPRHA